MRIRKNLSIKLYCELSHSPLKVALTFEWNCSIITPFSLPCLYLFLPKTKTLL